LKVCSFVELERKRFGISISSTGEARKGFLPGRASSKHPKDLLEKLGKFYQERTHLINS
jgi:hypothetical protein